MLDLNTALRETDTLIRKTNPTVGDVHTNGPLTNISVANFQDTNQFVAGRVFPIVPVQHRSDLYYEFDNADFHRNEMELRAPSTETAGGGFTVTSGTYSCLVYGYHKDIDDQIRANVDPQINLDALVAKYLTLKYLIFMEKQWASTFFTTSIWSKDVQGVAAGAGDDQVLQWNDDASTPIEDLDYYRRYMLELTGYEPNTLVLGRDVYDQIKNHPDFIDRVKYGQTPGAPARVTLENMKQLFEIPNIYVMNAIENTAKEGATKSHSFIAKQKALLTYSAPSPSLLSPSGGYTFSWTNYEGAGLQGQRITNMRIPLIRSDRFEIECAFDQKVISADLGVFFNDVVAENLNPNT